ncbi:MAG: alanine racemase [Armatimonadota bacterium]
MFKNPNKDNQIKDFPSWVEINLDALEHNYNQIKKITNGQMILPIVKADAYGHGVIRVCRKLENLGVKTVAVATLSEARQLSNSKINMDVLILLAGLPRQAETIVKYGFIQTVSSYQMAQALSEEAVKQNKTCRVHIKIDTGMNRLGFYPHEAVDAVKKIRNLKNIKIEGIYSHFSSSFIDDKDYTMLQWSRFDNILKELEKLGIEIEYKHISNSASIVDAAFIKLNMVRPGIMLYGLYPTQKLKNVISVEPILRLKAKLISVKKITADSHVSYGMTYTASKKSSLAVVPVGYADGYSRRLSHNISVTIKDKKYPVIGNICMDQIIVDITKGKNFKIGEEVTLIGGGANETSIDEIAQKTNTINYEITCGINKRLPKVYIENNEITAVETIFDE